MEKDVFLVQHSLRMFKIHLKASLLGLSEFDPFKVTSQSEPFSLRRRILSYTDEATKDKIDEINRLFETISPETDQFITLKKQNARLLAFHKYNEIEVKVDNVISLINNI